MRLLALDTATEACSAALWLDGQVLERFEVAGRTHTQRMLPMVHGLLADAGLGFAQIDGFVCGVGPGSFAGVRIGVGFIKGLALALTRPVVPVTSLAMLAQAALDDGAEKVLAAIDARMNEVYFGAFTRGADGLAISAEAAQVAAPGQLRVRGPGPWRAVGTGWGAYEPILRAGVEGTLESIDGATLPRASSALKLALPRFVAGEVAQADVLAPVYLRDKVALTLDEQVQLRASR